MIDFLQIDFPALLSGTLAAVVCALVGNFLVLTRQSMFGDAIGHVVLPGVIIAYLILGTTAAWAMLAGAAGAALTAAMMIEFFRRVAGVDPSAALGTVFTALFAFGVVLLEQSGLAGTTFDVHHILYGNVEGAIWPAATGWHSLVDLETLSALPSQVARLIVGLVLALAVIIIMFKELRAVSFDPVFAVTLGLNSRVIGAVITALAALAAVVSLEAVGVILVVAMMVCPPAAARLLTDDLTTQVKLSVIIAGMSGIGGYVIAAFGPGWLGYNISLGAAGTIAVVAGLFQLAAMIAGPKRRRAQTV